MVATLEHDKCIIELQVVVGNLLKLLRLEPKVEVNSMLAFEEELGRMRCAVDRLDNIFQVLNDVLQCPLTLQTFQQPMLAPDGHSYERSSILEWLRQNPVSPVTRQPMREDRLLRNRPLERLVEVLHGPQLEEHPGACDKSENKDNSQELLFPGASTSLEEPRRASVVLDLVTAIEEHAQDSALALAQRPIERAVLDGMFGELQAPLHIFAQLHGLSEVALAIINRADYAEGVSFLGSRGQRSITGLHLAAALGDQAFCEAFVARCGGFYVIIPVLEDITLTLANGHQLSFRTGTTAVDIARSAGHHNLWRMLEAAYEEP